MLNQIITMSLSEYHEYYTRNKNTINADSPKSLSDLVTIESKLMQNIANLKDEAINLKNIIIKIS